MGRGSKPEQWEASINSSGARINAGGARQDTGELRRNSGRRRPGAGRSRRQPHDALNEPDAGSFRKDIARILKFILVYIGIDEGHSSRLPDPPALPPRNPHPLPLSMLLTTEVRLDTRAPF